MAGIVAALEAHDDVSLFRQPVDDLALPLVAPLGADDDNIGHFLGLPSATLMVRACRERSYPRISPRVCFPEHAPSQNRGPRPLGCEAYHRIKEAAPLGKQEG